MEEDSPYKFDASEVSRSPGAAKPRHHADSLRNRCLGSNHERSVGLASSHERSLGSIQKMCPGGSQDLFPGYPDTSYEWSPLDYTPGSRMDHERFSLSVDGSRIDPEEYCISVEGSQVSITTGSTRLHGILSHHHSLQEYEAYPPQPLSGYPLPYQTGSNQFSEHQTGSNRFPERQNVSADCHGAHCDHPAVPQDCHTAHFDQQLLSAQEYHHLCQISQQHQQQLSQQQAALSQQLSQCRLHSTPSRTRRRRGGSVSSSSDHSFQDGDRFSIMSGTDRISMASTTSTLDRSTMSSTGRRSIMSVEERLTPTSDWGKTTPDWGRSSSEMLLSSSADQGTSASCQPTPRTRHRNLKTKQSSIQSQPPSPGGLSVREERTPGCCTLSQEEPTYSTLSSGKPQPVSNCVKSFMSWMVTKAGKGTAAILDSLPQLSKEDFHVVMIGLDGAGKTTALYRLKFDQYINTVPTIGFNCERIRGTVGKSKGLTFLIWDVGGQEKIRPLWRSYTRCTDGIIFVVDSADQNLFEEAKMELFKTMRYQDNSSVPLLILANKQDLPNSVNTKQIEEALSLKDLNTSLWQVEAACSITGEGLDTGLEVLHQLILKKKKMLKRNRNKTK